MQIIYYGNIVILLHARLLKTLINMRSFIIYWFLSVICSHNGAGLSLFQCTHSAILWWQIRPSVRLSVRLSVYVSNAGTVSIQMYISSHFLTVW